MEAQVVKDGQIVEAEETEIEKEIIDDETEETGNGQEADAIDDADDEEKELWQNIDESEKEGVPTSTHLRVKQKLKGRIHEKDSEIEELRKEIAALKAGERKPVVTDLKRPRENDFDSFEEYEEALDRYEENRIAAIEDRKKREETFQKSIESRKAAVDSHYSRADEFVTKYGIAPEKYQKADESVRKAVETVLPGQGEVVTDHLISILGDGSEKVLFRVGAKPEVLREFQSLLLEDKTGLKAGIFLGRQLEIITNPKKRVSNAPPPGRQLKGDAPPSANAMALKKSYSEAHKKGDTQRAYNLKKQARESGVNVSTW